ncbi:MAG: ABC transporter ATP-binding protein, partial [Chryseotalea sp.]
MHEPRLIILDEPFSGFDPVNAQLITEQILDLRKNGSTIIFSTHRMETVEDLCDHVALINKSKKIVEGTKKQIKDTYKTNTFSVEHKGTFSINGQYELVSQTKVDDNYYHSIVRTQGSLTSPNELIQQLIGLTDVHAFVEKVPSMSEIFIHLVKGKSDE